MKISTSNLPVDIDRTGSCCHAAQHLLRTGALKDRSGFVGHDGTQREQSVTPVLVQQPQESTEHLENGCVGKSYKCKNKI